MPISDVPPSVGGLAVIGDAAVLEPLDELGVFRREGLEGAAVGVRAGDLLAGNDRRCGRCPGRRR